MCIMGSTSQNRAYETGFYNLLNRFLSIVSSSSPEEIDTIINSSLTEVCKVFGVDEAFVAIIDKSSKAYSYGYESRMQDHLTMGERIPFGTYPWTEKMILANRQIRIKDLGDLPEEARTDLEIYYQAGLKSLLVVPLMGKEQTVKGCIGFRVYQRSRSWTDEDGKQLIILGSIIANFLERRIAEKERDDKDRYISLLNRFTQIALESDDFQDALIKISVNLKELTGADLCGFGLLDSNRKIVYPAAAFGANAEELASLNLEFGDKTITEIALNSGKPLVIDDLSQSEFRDWKIARAFQVCSVLVLPLKSKSNRLGSALLGYRNHHRFTSEEVERCKQATEQVTLALNKIQLLEKNQRQIESLDTISRISSAMRGAQSLSEIPGMIMDKVIELCKVKNVELIFSDSSKDSRVFFQSGEDWKSLTNEDFIGKYPFIEDVLEHGKTIQIPPADEITVGSTEGKEADFVMVFPLISHRQALGAFCVQSQSPFTGEKSNLISAIADLIANAAYRQSLVDNLQLQLEILRTTRMQLVQREKLAAIGGLIAGVAHELNNPLTTIELTSEFLMQQTTDGQERDDLTKIISESRRAAMIVRSLLDFSRQRAPERKTVEINAILSSTVELVKDELSINGIKCEILTIGNIPVTIADPYQLKQVFINVITNAIQALKEVDHARVLKITLEAGPSKYYGQVNNPDLFINIAFEDNGPGISPSALPRIFDPFFTTKMEQDGTGLGLSVCHGIITEHGGHIWAESSHAGGTTMFIEIPIKISTNEKADTELAEKDNSKNSSRILVVEDEANVLDIIQRSLVRKGYSVDGAENGLDGLKKLDSQHYDLIICDIRMPGMGGIEFFHEIIKRDPSLTKRMVFTSGGTVSEESQKVLKLTGCTLLQKPFELAKLLQIVSEKINEKG